jgi:GAF domain-containing protein
MITRFRKLIAGTSQEPDIAHRQYLLNIILLGLAGPGFIFGIVMLVLWLLDMSPPTGAIAGLGVQPFYILAYLLGRRGQVRVAGFIPVAVVFAAMAGSFFQVGVGHISTIGLAMVVVTAGILIGAGAATLFTLLGVVAYLAGGWAQLNGYVPDPLIPIDTVIIDAIGLGLGLLVLVIFNWMANREMQRALQLERSLSSRLQAQSQDLEDQVAQRTASLERKAAQLETTAEISRLTSEMMDPSDLMSQSVDLILKRFDFYHVSIFLLDETGLWANLVASTGEAGKALISQHHRLATGSASIIGWVTANRLPRVTTNVADDPFYFRNPLLPETRSEMAVPLIVGTRLLGALDVQSTTPEAFMEDDIRAVEAIAAELAIAIDSTRLIQETQRQLEQFESSYRDLARQSWRRIARSPGEYDIRIGTPEISGIEEEGAFTTSKQSEDSGLPVLSDDRRELSVPVQMRGEIIATITARRGEDEELWSDDDVSLLRAVAGQTALALESARQYAEEHRRVAELEVINRVSQAVSQHLRLDSLYRVVHAQVNQVLGETDMYIGLYEKSLDQLHFPYVSENREVIRVAPLPLEDGLPSLIIRTQQPLLLQEDTVRRVKALGSALEDKVAQSWLGVPLMTGEDILGVIVVQDFENEQRFSEDDAALMTTIASQVATAIQNAQLMEQIQQTARRERLIHEIASKVRRAPDMKSILSTTARELNRAFNATSTSIQLRTQSSKGEADKSETVSEAGEAEMDQTGAEDPS